MFGENLAALRKMRQMTQDELAERVGVSRQAVGKWEAGETEPALGIAQKVAEVFGVSLDEMTDHKPELVPGAGLPPKGKHLFGVVTVGEKGQIIIPAKARKIFGLSAGDQLIVLGDENQGLALVPPRLFI